MSSGLCQITSTRTISRSAASGRRLAFPDWAGVLKPDFLTDVEPVWRSGRVALRDPAGMCPEADEWDRHWQHLDRSLRGRAFSFYRRQIRSRCVARALARRFPETGIFAECGCGSGETSGRIQMRPGQTFLAVDFAWHPLSQAMHQSCFAGGVQADIRRLPFHDRSLDGLWNLGVLEHFKPDEQILILREFHRVLKPGAPVVLWWPPRHAPDRLLLSPFGWPFPDEPGRADRVTARKLLVSAGFDEVTARYAGGDCLTEMILTGTKGAHSAASEGGHRE